MRADAPTGHRGGAGYTAGDLLRGFVAMLLAYLAAMIVIAVIAVVGQPAGGVFTALIIVVGGLAVGAPALGLAIPVALLVERMLRRRSLRARLTLQTSAGSVLGAATGWVAFGASSGGWWITLIGAAAGGALAAIGRSAAERSIRARALERL